MPASRLLQGIKYSPHFRIFDDGVGVDEFLGADPLKIRDRMWLHNNVYTVPKKKSSLLADELVDAIQQ